MNQKYHIEIFGCETAFNINMWHLQKSFYKSISNLSTCYIIFTVNEAIAQRSAVTLFWWA